MADEGGGTGVEFCAGSGQLITNLSGPRHLGRIVVRIHGVSHAATALVVGSTRGGRLTEAKDGRDAEQAQRHRVHNYEYLQQQGHDVDYCQRLYSSAQLCMSQKTLQNLKRAISVARCTRACRCRDHCLLLVRSRCSASATGWSTRRQTRVALLPPRGARVRSPFSASEKGAEARERGERARSPCPPPM